MKNKDLIWRIYLVFLLMGVLCVAIISKVFAIQNSSSYEIVEEKKKELIKERAIEPIRGTIYSADGAILATSDPVFDLHWDAVVVDDDLFQEKVDSLALGLAKIFPERNKNEWKSKLVAAKESNSRYAAIHGRVSRRDFREIMNLPIFRLGQYKGGLISEKKDQRKRQYSPLADRTIGYVRQEGDELKIPVGIENAYNEVLSGVQGIRRMRKSGQRWIPVDDKYIVVPENGKDVHTTIDINIQDVATNELMRQLESQEAEHGCAILMEVETGYIRAIANLSRLEDGSYYEMFNHAVGSATEPGSTFKLASLIVGLEDGAFDLDSKEDTEDGTHKFYDRTMRDSKVGGYGVITCKEAFKVSSNVWFSKKIFEAYNGNPQKYVDGVKKLLGSTTGIEIKGEANPYIKDASDSLWSGVSLPWMSIGYETKLTPLQILTFYNAVANNGVAVKPQLVEEIRSAGEVVETFDPVVLNPRICSPGTIIKAKECMEAVVEDGTGVKLQTANFKIAGKTGTTQLASGNLGYKVGKSVKYQASFCGYFPADDPKYTCIVVIAAPERQKYGADVAGTVFKAIADKVYATSIAYHEAINKKRDLDKTAPKTKAGEFNATKKVLEDLELSMITSDQVERWIAATQDNQKVVLEKRYIGDETMPNVSGMGLRDALYILENRGLVVQVEGSGKVVSQSVQAGKPIQKNQPVKIVLK